MRILYVGASSGTSGARYAALATLGHETQIIDPYGALPASRLARSWSFRTGALGFETRINRYVMAQVEGWYDLVLIDNGELIGAKLLKWLRGFAPRTCSINYDNPYGTRDGGRWRLFLKALPLYDIVFTCRDTSVVTARMEGAKQVERIWHTVADALIDPANHPTDAERAPYRARVAFIGTWMPERGPFLAELIERGVPLRIFGPRWQKAPEYPRLERHVTLGSLNTRQFEAAIAAAEISLGLTSKGNDDLSTHRSMEIPILGSVLCGQRTADHLRLYDEGREAVFFDDAEECATACLALLADPDRLAAIRNAGRRRNISNGHFNRQLMERLVTTATKAA